MIFYTLLNIQILNNTNTILMGIIQSPSKFFLYNNLKCI